MQKNFFTLTLLSSAVFLSGCFTKTATITSDQTAAEASSEWQKIAEAMENGDAVRCEILHEESNAVSYYYMQGQNVRFDSENSVEQTASGSFLTDGKVAYSWNTTTKDGVKFSLEDPSVTEMEQPVDSKVTAPDFTSQEEWDAYQEQGYRMTCRVEQLPAELFIPPSDVTFMDVSQMTQQFQLMMDSSGSSAPPQPTEEEIRLMMQQYSQVGQ